jgi:hypothetical protein
MEETKANEEGKKRIQAITGKSHDSIFLVPERPND